MRLKTIVDVDDARAASAAQDATFAPDAIAAQGSMSLWAPSALSLDGTAFLSPTLDYSADPYAGTVAANGKEIWSVQEAADNLHRTGTDWTHGNYGALDDGILTFGFWTYEQFMSSYFFERVAANGTPSNADAFYAVTYKMFEAFRADQQVAAANAIDQWDDLINVTFQLGEPGTEADIMFGAVYEGAGVGAHAYYPQAEALDSFYHTTDYGKTSGDVMINWLYNAPNGGTGGNTVGLNRPADNSFSNFAYGSYGNFAIMHELGHSLGLAHGGDYNASSGGGAITYTKDAYFYQDSNQYTIMSYFLGNVTGQSAANLDNLMILYAQTPAVHDIYSVQQIYGADMTTRAGDTVYGFNSTADKGMFDFTLNDHPVLTIWDAGGNDTLDLSGFNSNSIIDLNEGAFSSASNKVTDAVKAADMAALGIANETQWQAFLAKYALNSDGSLHDNISIAYGAKIENAIGGVGNDTMTGNGLDNMLIGNAGNDTISGGLGNDTLIGGTGNDALDGGAGIDTASYASASAAVTVSLVAGTASGGGGNDTLTAIENVVGSAFGDRIIGDAAANVINAGHGYDVVTLGGGNDVYVADQGATAATKAGMLSLDLITDFTTGQDKIDLSGLGNGHFNFRGSAANKNADDLTYKVYDSVNGAEKALGIDIHSHYSGDLSGPVTVVFADTDHQAGADTAIILLNHNGVSASDFLMAA